MKSPLWRRCCVCMLVISSSLFIVSTGYGQLGSLNSNQVESLNPNPTTPQAPDRGGALEQYRHGSSRGTRIGLGVGATDGADKNPAEIMLRDINGTNRGRKRGHAAIKGKPARAARKLETGSSVPTWAQEGAVYFARRGDYENAIYAPQRGTYRVPAPRQRQTAYRSNNRR